MVRAGAQDLSEVSCLCERPQQQRGSRLSPRQLCLKPFLPGLVNVSGDRLGSSSARMPTSFIRASSTLANASAATARSA